MQDDWHRISPVASALRSQSTWRLAMLSLLTLGIYTGIYIQRQSFILDEFLPAQRRFSRRFVLLVRNLQIASAAGVLAYFFTNDDEAVDSFNRALEFAASLSMVVWAFQARSRLHSAFGSKPGDLSYLNGFWLFILSPLYLNYHVNKIERVASSSNN